MPARVERLFEVFDRLFAIKEECSSEIFSECGLDDMTARQVAYLRAIDEHHDVTFSRLAEITSNSKPTITEMVNRFVRMECAYRQKCPDDGRVTYIRLTRKGRMIANSEQNALYRMIDRVVRALDEGEVDLLLEILKKVG
ncbi:MAG: winged helix-turn-helix transcriptional regulator [Methanomicrobiales archaeon]|nr:winged helix-turn-helix transcriptional regulator [Methanomicrobiales archaeon]